jgi:hypothetical protein
MKNRWHALRPVLFVLLALGLILASLSALALAGTPRVQDCPAAGEGSLGCRLYAPVILRNGRIDHARFLPILFQAGPPAIPTPPPPPEPPTSTPGAYPAPPTATPDPYP